MGLENLRKEQQRLLEKEYRESANRAANRSKGTRESLKRAAHRWKGTREPEKRAAAARKGLRLENLGIEHGLLLLSQIL